MKTILSWTGALSGIALLNSGLFYLTSAMGSPTVIGGLGWLLDHPTLGNPMIQLIVFGGSLALVSKFYAEEEQPETTRSDFY